MTAENIFAKNGLLTVREAAEKLDCSKTTIYKLHAQGELRIIRIFAKKGVIKESDIQAFIEKRLQIA